MDWKYYFRRINKRTRGRYDVTPIFEDPEAFSNLIKDLTAPFQTSRIDKVLGIDALGFILAAAISYRLKKPLVLARKGGRLPYVPKDLLTLTSSHH
jgi:adenine/guanine phosphoribosyltransferase-like PRPP-binding protein